MKSLARRLISQHHKTLKPKQTQLLIDGKFVNSIDGQVFGTINPTTAEKIVDIQEGGEKDIDLAVKSARKAFDHGPWRKTGPEARRKILNKLADLLERDLDEIAMLETLDNGKPVSHAKIDVVFSAKILRYYGGWTDKIHGTTIPVSGPYMSYTR